MVKKIGGLSLASSVAEKVNKHEDLLAQGQLLSYEVEIRSRRTSDGRTPTVSQISVFLLGEKVAWAILRGRYTPTSAEREFHRDPSRFTRA